MRRKTMKTMIAGLALAASVFALPAMAADTANIWVRADGSAVSHGLPRTFTNRREILAAMRALPRPAPRN